MTDTNDEISEVPAQADPEAHADAGTETAPAPRTRRNARRTPRRKLSDADVVLIPVQEDEAPKPRRRRAPKKVTESESTQELLPIETEKAAAPVILSDEIEVPAVHAPRLSRRSEETDEIPESYSSDDDTERDEPTASSEDRNPERGSSSREEADSSDEDSSGDNESPTGEDNPNDAADEAAGSEEGSGSDDYESSHYRGRYEDRQRHGQQQGGGNNFNDRRQNKRQKFKNKKKQGGGFSQQGPSQQQRSAPQPRPQRRRNEFQAREENSFIEIGDLPDAELFRDPEGMEALFAAHQGGGDPVDLCELLTANIHELMIRARDEFGIHLDSMPVRSQIVEQIIQAAWEANRAISAEGVVEVSQEGFGLLVYQHDSYRIKPLCTFVPRVTMKRFGLKRGHIVKAFIQPPRRELTTDGNRENCPVVLKVESIMGRDPALNLQTEPFEELTPYYPTERFLLETEPGVKWDNVSMRVVDLLTPVGKGQRGLIVAPPRTGKTILQQGIANSIMRNNPEVHLIVLLVDERPEEVTDFRRQITRGEVIASTFDENAESHVHAAEMVIEKARRMVEVGTHVVILLDSITRLARAYNALAGNSGKILSGGVEATAMQKPKRFFGSARNIEGGGSLTILGTALVETGSRMDEVIFEEFKGTGNMELVLDRTLTDKRIFPAINLEKSGTRKEELLYHPDEMVKVYGLRRAMKGVPPPDAMEMLITRVKKTKTNIEFLMGLNR